MNAFDEYLQQATTMQKVEFGRVRALVHQQVPKVEESITYNMPTYRYHGKYLLWIGVYKNHMTLFPDHVLFSPEKPLGGDILKKAIDTQLAAIAKGEG